MNMFLFNSLIAEMNSEQLQDPLTISIIASNVCHIAVDQEEQLEKPKFNWNSDDVAVAAHFEKQRNEEDFDATTETVDENVFDTLVQDSANFELLRQVEEWTPQPDSLIAMPFEVLSNAKDETLGLYRTKKRKNPFVVQAEKGGIEFEADDDELYYTQTRYPLRKKCAHQVMQNSVCHLSAYIPKIITVSFDRSPHPSFGLIYCHRGEEVWNKMLQRNIMFHLSTQHPTMWVVTDQLLIHATHLCRQVLEMVRACPPSFLPIEFTKMVFDTTLAIDEILVSVDNLKTQAFLLVKAYEAILILLKKWYEFTFYLNIVSIPAPFDTFPGPNVYRLISDVGSGTATFEFTPAPCRCAFCLFPQQV